jgi:hypothetical protein
MRASNGLTAFLVATLATVSVACGGGSGGGGGGGPSPAPPSFVGSFTPDADPPGSSTVALGQGAAGSGDLVRLEVNLTDIDDVYGASFAVMFDPASARFINRSPGTLLERGGQAVLYQHSVPQPGRLEVGVTRVDAVPGVNVSGTATLVYLTFQVTRAGTSAVTFGNADLLDSQPPPQPIGGLSWYGGTLVAN